MRNPFVQLGTFALAVVGFVLLTIEGQDTASFLGMVTPILAAVFVISRLDQRSDAQDQTLAKISHQTNGVLTERIRKAVGAELEKHKAP